MKIKKRELYLLLSTLFSVCLITPCIVNATHIGVTWGSTYLVETQFQEPANSDACSYISNLINGRANWAANNFYGASTTEYNVHYTSDAVKNNGNYDILATFHVGHMYPSFVSGTRHYSYYGSQGSTNGIKDWNLYSHTGAKHYFTFIWSCTQADLIDIDDDGDGDVYGFYDYENNSGVVGMPYSWTHTTSMNQNGYASPDAGSYCYISFENTSKPLSDNSEFGDDNNYGDFLKAFYYHAIVNHDSIKTALDHATQDMGIAGKYYFSQTWLYNGYWEYSQQHGMWFFCKMRVFGNGNMVLPS